MKGLQVISKNFKTNKFVLTFISGIALVSTILGISALVLNNQAPKQALAASEPACALGQTVTTGTWNPYPITTQYANPQPAQCLDLPLLAFFPLDGTNGLPREKTITKKSDVFTIHAYYNNGAKPGTGSISNPRIKIFVDKVSTTRLKISAELLGDNASTVTSAQKGGDLFVNIPSGASFNYSGGTTRHYIDAIERREAADATGAIPFDNIGDYTVTDAGQTRYMNPIYARYDGYNLTQNSGFQIKSGGLESGFLGYGYILSDISIRSQAPLGNLPPAITGEEITIIRGQTGGFPNPLNPTDPDNNFPISLNTTSVIPSWCTLSGTPNAQGGGQMIGGCKTDANTPVRTTFVITPTDSLGLVGTPGTWIINVIDPTWNAEKRCFKLNTTTPCNQAPLSAGDKIKYEIQVNNTTTNIDANNLKIVDTYDKVKIGQVTNISDNGTVDANAGVVTWANLGTLRASSSKTVSFEATITQAVSNGDDVINRAKITADNFPELNVDVKFTIGGALEILKKCFAKGTTTPCDQAKLKGGDPITYQINVNNSTQSALNNVVVVDTYEGTKINNVTNINPTGTLDSANYKITWNLGTLASSSGKILTFDANIVSSIQAGTKIKNIAVVTADGVPEKRAEVEFPIAGPNLQAVKSCFKKGTNTPCDQAALNSGDLISYRIRITNTGAIQATGVKVTDTYDKTKINTIININPTGTLDATAGTIFWDIGNVIPSATVDLTFDATINLNLPSGTQILNTAVVKSNEQPDIIVSVVFPLQFLPPITPRTGGEIYLVAVVAIALMGGYAFYYYKKNNKVGQAFVPGRSQENELSAPIKETEVTEHKHRNYHVRGAKKHKD
jgi:uncharacterized repeat protein (TIGR01451 family)